MEVHEKDISYVYGDMDSMQEVIIEYVRHNNTEETESMQFVLDAMDRFDIFTDGIQNVLRVQIKEYADYIVNNYIIETTSYTETVHKSKTEYIMVEPLTGEKQ